MTNRASVADFGMQCDFPATCMDEQCVNDRAVINNLRTTVEVLEAELRNLRETGWGKPLKINNRFAALKTDFEESGNKNKNYKRPKLGWRTNTPNTMITSKPTARKEAQPPVFKPKASMPSRMVWINSDSHGRDIAELFQSMVTGDTTVEGACRPGAKLQTREPTILQLGSRNIFINICSSASLKTAKVIVSTLPHRHNPPTDHPINKETGLWGSGVRHGTHLKTKSKRFLARHLVECMHELGQIPGVALSSPPTDTRRQSSASRKSSSAGVTEPRALPYETR
ncbi:hypothetical protein J6590_024628 [Homalodisca vitripennis]|nr:hypothetical protein J6590_024628 [Homalodisca vitripennis]